MNKEKINELLELQNQGKTIAEVAEIFGEKEKSIKEYMRRAGYKTIGGIFYKDNEEFIMNVNKKEEKKNNYLPELVTELIEDNEENAKKLDKIIELLEANKEEKNEKQELIITSSVLDLDNLSIRIDKKTKKRFNDFCNKYSHVAKSYLFDRALQEFMDKYN